MKKYLYNAENDIKDFSSEFLSDVNLQSITGQIFIGHAILVAYELGLFKLICNKNLSIQAISTHLNLSQRSTQAMISCAGALDLVECARDEYTLSRLGKLYLDANSSEYYGKVLDLLIQEHEVMNYENIKKVLLSNKSVLNKCGSLFAESDLLSKTQCFIDALHQKAFKPAFYCSKIIDLKNNRKFIDIGGGSGIYTIAACLNRPSLEGIVCDRNCVLPFTTQYIREFDLEDRVGVFGLDMWNDPFPEGDVYFFGDIFHDWGMDKCIFLANKCFKCLPSGGKIILHEMLFNADKTGPFLTSAYNMKMMAWTEGQQYSVNEILEILNRAGFSEVRIEQALGNWSVISGTKK